MPSFEFSGSVSILIEVIKPTTVISLNSYRLVFFNDNVKLKTKSRREIKVAMVHIDNTYQIADILVVEKLEKGKEYILEIKGFKSTLRDDMAGFYKSSYKTPKGETR